MASYGNMAPVAAPRHGHHHGPHGGSPASMPIQPGPSAPAGTFSPGTKIQVGDHRVIIQKYLSEGGFAHVYLVRLPKPIDGTDLAVLKRVAVPDRDSLRNMRTEVETMKRLKGHRPIVTYMDSHASELRGGGYEVFLLMEYCNGGGLIDFMNTRLQHRLTEPEILNIFADIAEGVACMHYLKPPLLHRDLKVENVLITMVGSKRKFKVCDFGSSAPPKPAPQSIVECRLMDEDVQRHTTMQYRAPEMVDVYRKQPLDEKSDIWALGVLLYKLCYYTTPFEEQGQLAILNASFKFPSYPAFSDRLKQLIASMLRESQSQRPNIYQVLRESCNMQGREVPIQDIYSNRSQSEPRKVERQPLPDAKGRSTPVVGAVYSPPPQQQTTIPDVVPMRRGRPPTTSQQPAHQAPRPSASPMRVINGDPFSALDSGTSKRQDPDELSNRFPSLDQFSLLHDQGAQFDFDNSTSPPPKSHDLSQRVTNKLADDAFAKPLPDPVNSPDHRQSVDFSKIGSVAIMPDFIKQSAPLAGAANRPTPGLQKDSPNEMSRASAIISKHPELQAIASGPSKPGSLRPSKNMVSTGTMTASPPPAQPTRDYPPIHRFPPADRQPRSASLPRQPEPGSGQLATAELPPRPAQSSRMPLLGQPRHAASARPSLEASRPSLEMLEPLAKSASQTSRPRPVSTHLESDIDYLREIEAAPRPMRSPGLQANPKFPERTSPSIEPQDETVIESNVDFLRSMEDSDGKKKGKRASLTSLSGTKNILAGKFGPAFKRFEGSASSAPGRTPSPLKDLDRSELTPIAGSEATDGRSDDGAIPGDNEDELTPAMRREREAKELADEEKRVEAAQAEYRQKLAARDQGTAAFPKSIGGVSRASSIQNRVQNLLDESQKGAPVQKTAQGYGRFSDAATASSRFDKELPSLPRKAIGGAGRGSLPKPTVNTTDPLVRARHTASMPAAVPSPESPSRPPVPPKPNAKPAYLNNVSTGDKTSPTKVRAPGPPGSSDRVGTSSRPSLPMSPQEKEDYLRDFSKRFPSLSSIEMVERDLGAESDKRGGGR